ncbi:MAG: Hpt domain-containing protein, partial [Xanthomonadaceae bacterium]|nr:Hpt domain-containing protein [Xanthomonadaceae bacterium]
MNVLREAIEHATLGWIKPELDATLTQVRQEIEAYVEDAADPARMRLAATLLHQVQGSLKMIELYAPAMVAGEMQDVASAVADGRIDDTDDACAVLMRGSVQLPDYLERLQGGHRDIPIVLMPLLNELRAAHGMKPVSEVALFRPDLEMEMPGLPVDEAAGNGASQLAALTTAVDAWQDDGAGLDAAALHDALQGLSGADVGPDARRMFWVGAELAAALRDGAIADSGALRGAYRNVAHESRSLLRDAGSGALPTSSSLEATRQLLYIASAQTAQHPALQRLRETFGLDQQVAPGDDELAHASASLTGRNRALLDTVSAAIKEDVLRIKDALDLHLRTGREDAEVLRPQAEALGRVADTLGMLGLGMARDVVAEQRDVVGAIADGRRPMSEPALLDVAGALLYVDASLDDQVARLGEEAAIRPRGDAEGSLGASEAHQLLDALTREAIANFGDARQGFVAFVETGWDHSQLVEIPRLLDEVGGALRMLDLPDVADYLVGIRRYTQTELLDRKRVPGGQQLDTLADALSSVEYYLEALRDQRGGRDEILAITRHSLEALRYWPLPLESESTETPFLDNEFENAYQQLLDNASSLPRPVHAGHIVPEAAANADDRVIERDVRFDAGDVDALAGGSDATPGAEEAARAPSVDVAPVREGFIAPAAPLPVAEGGFDLANQEIDDEIREIFLEEFGEEIANLDTLIPAWREAPAEVERLRPIRRVFHTLKGSGRLVGARVLGEFSWKVENMLNRVLDETRSASPAVVALVGQAHGVLPALLGALQGVPASNLDLPGLEAVADRLAAGEEVIYTYTAAEPAAPETVEATEAALPVGVGDEVEETVADAAPENVEIVEAAAARVPVQVDAVLLEILGVEVDGHLQTVDRWLVDDEAAARVPDRELLRAVHTMNGAFAMAEVPEITDAIGPAEGWTKRLVAAEQPLGAAGIAALARLSAQIRETVAGLQVEPQSVPTQTALAAEFIALRDSLPEAAPHIVLPVQEDVEAERIEAERIEAERIEAERIEA